MATLRDLTSEDLGDVVRWRNDPDVNRFLADRLRSKDSAESWFNQLRTNPKIWLKAIVAEEQLIGYAVVESIDEKNRRCEMALVVGETDYWGRGIGASVLQTMLEYAFNELNMHRVWAAVANGNDRSERLLRGAGFLQEGVMRETIIIGGKFTDLLCFSMLEDEYRSVKTEK